MGANSQPATAKIYQFPRKTSAGALAERDPRLPRDDKSQALPRVEFGSGWYHDAALAAERPRKP